MGSWNGTCALSRLPINREDKVLLFLLLKNKYESNLGCGYASSSPYISVCIPICGEYNETGRIENFDFDERVDEKTILKHMNNLFKRKLISHEENVEYKVEDLKSFISDVSTGMIKDMSFMLVFEDLYYDVMSEFSLRKGFDENESIKERAIISAKEYIEEKKLDKDMFFQYDEYLFSRFFYSNKMRFLLDNIVETDNEKLLSEMIDLYIFNELLNISRILWTPQAGAGSQYTEYEVHKRIGQYASYKEMNQKITHRKENVTDAEEYENLGKSTPMFI